MIRPAGNNKGTIYAQHSSWAVVSADQVFRVIPRAPRRHEALYEQVPRACARCGPRISHGLSRSEGVREIMVFLAQSMAVGNTAGARAHFFTNVLGRRRASRDPAARPLPAWRATIPAGSAFRTANVRSRDRSGPMRPPARSALPAGVNYALLGGELDDEAIAALPQSLRLLQSWLAEMLSRERPQRGRLRKRRHISGADGSQG